MKSPEQHHNHCCAWLDAMKYLESWPTTPQDQDLRLAEASVCTQVFQRPWLALSPAQLLPSLQRACFGHACSVLLQLHMDSSHRLFSLRAAFLQVPLVLSISEQEIYVCHSSAHHRSLGEAFAMAAHQSQTLCSRVLGFCLQPRASAQ